MYGLGKIHCWSLYLLFEMSSNFDWDPSKSEISCFFVEISLRTLTLRAKISTMKHVILTMSIFLESWGVTLSTDILLIMSSIFRGFKMPSFDTDFRRICLERHQYPSNQLISQKSIFFAYFSIFFTQNFTRKN